jgi:MFS family permease
VQRVGSPESSRVPGSGRLRAGADVFRQLVRSRDLSITGTVFGLGLSLLVLATAQGPIMLAVAWTLSRCLGQGAVGVGMLAALSRAFHAQRGRALAIGTLGYPFGEFIFPAVVAGLLAFTAWRQSLLLLAGVYLVLFTPVLLACLRRVPHADPRAPAGIRRSDSVAAYSRARGCPGNARQPLQSNVGGN